MGWGSFSLHSSSLTPSPSSSLSFLASLRQSSDNRSMMGSSGSVNLTFPPHPRSEARSAERPNRVRRGMKVGPHLSPYTPFPPATGPKGAERIRREMGTVAPFSHALFGSLTMYDYRETRHYDSRRDLSFPACERELD